MTQPVQTPQTPPTPQGPPGPLTWTQVFTDNERNWTWCAPVPGGWIYRHRSVPFERPAGAIAKGFPVKTELVPIACETMVFVPAT